MAALADEQTSIHQAEDEIAAIGAALGASYGGALAATATSGPGFSLKSEFLGLAVMAELPLVIIDVQRAGPSTGMPTKTSQGDLNQALFGRHGDSPCPVLAPSSPTDCFESIMEAAEIATKFMTPVIVLSDAFLAMGSEVWQIPNLSERSNDPMNSALSLDSELARKGPYARDPQTKSRPWITPGIDGLEHTIGGLEKAPMTGEVSYESQDHARMIRRDFRK